MFNEIDHLNKMKKGRVLLICFGVSETLGFYSLLSNCSASEMKELKNRVIYNL